MTILISLCLLLSFLNAEDIYFKNGAVLKNVHITDKGEDYWVVKKADGQFLKLYRWNIERVESTPFRPDINTELSGIIPPEPQEITTTRPNLKLLPITFIGLFLALDTYQDASDINATIKDIRDLNPEADVSRLEGQRGRKYVYGTIFLATAIVNTFIAFKNVEVKATPQQIQLSIKL